MIKRKVITTLLATPISLMFIFAIFFGEWNRPVELIAMSGAFSLFLSPFIVLYGVPVAFLSDYISKRFNGNSRISIAFLVHLFFGLIFGLVFPMSMHHPFFGVEVSGGMIFASIVALFFWITDELLRKVKFKKHVFSNCCFNFAKQ